MRKARKGETEQKMRDFHVKAEEKKSYAFSIEEKYILPFTKE